MIHDFTTVHRRFDSGSSKWDMLDRLGYRDNPDVIPFSVADMEFVMAPEIVEEISNTAANTVLGYANPTAAYKETVCRWMKERHGWNAMPEWILPSHGCVDALFSAINTFTNPGDGILVMSPVYYPFYTGIRYNGRVLVETALVSEGNSYKIDFEDFEKKAKDPNTKLLAFCSPHNPVGRVWTLEELGKISRICNDNGVLVVSDEIHFDLVMPGHKHIVYADVSKEAEQNCIILTAPSKTFNLAGLQTSNVFCPNEKLRSSFMNGLKTETAYPKCNILGYAACKAAYEKCEQWLGECLEVIDTNRRMVQTFMDREFPQIKIYDLQATYLLWMDWSGLGLDYKELKRINQEEAGLIFDEGYIFGKQGECFERWNLACPTEYIGKALARMKETYGKYVR